MPLAGFKTWKKTLKRFCYAENSVCYIDDVITTVKRFQGRSRSIANII